MQRKFLALTALVAVLAIAGVAQAQEQTQSSWIHIRVDEGGDGAKVNVNLPMSLIEVALEIAEKEAFDGDHDLRFGRHHDMDIEDLRRMWNELRATGDAQYVNVEDGDERVSVYRRGDRVHIEVDEGDDEKVRVEVPFSVVDILLEGEGERLNFAGAIRELARTNNGEIIQVNDGDTTVRIWIDNSTEG